MIRSEMRKTKSDDQPKIMRPQKTPAHKVREQNHRGVSNARTVVTSVRVFTRHQLYGVENNNVESRECLEASLYTVREGRSVNDLVENGRLLLYEE